LASYINDISPSPVAVIVASRGLNSMKRINFGSTCDFLVHHLKVPVMVVKEDPPILMKQEGTHSEMVKEE